MFKDILSLLTDKRGVTLIESIITLSLVGVLLVTTFSFLLINNATFTREVLLMSNLQNVSKLQDLLDKDIRSADAFTATPVIVGGVQQGLHLTLNYPTYLSKPSIRYEIDFNTGVVLRLEGVNVKEVTKGINYVSATFNATTSTANILIQGGEGSQETQIEFAILLRNY